MNSADNLPPAIAKRLQRGPNWKPHFDVTRAMGYAGIGCGWIEFNAETGAALRLRYATDFSDGETEQNGLNTREHVGLVDAAGPATFWATIDPDYGHPETGDPEEIIDLTPAPGAWVETDPGPIRVFVNFSNFVGVLA